MKKASLFVWIFAGLLAASTAWADCPKSHGNCDKGSCDKSAASCSKGDCDDEYACPLVAKVMKKAHFFLDNKAEIGLSEEQVRSIKAIKMDVKKSYMRQGVESQIFMMDLQAKMSEPQLDVEGINGMLDQGMAAMTANCKSTVASYAKLKAVVTPEQLEKAKAIWEKTQK